MTASPVRASIPSEQRPAQRRPLQSVPAVTAADRAALIQRQLDRQELQCSLMALGAKLGLILLGCVSVARLSFAYQERLDRHSEIAAVVALETTRLESLQAGFDRLFTVGGEQRLLENQDQWIAPNRLRVVWR